MNLEECITEIIGRLTAGDYFDSHTVINDLQVNPKYHLAYLHGCTPDSTVSLYHSRIAKMIGANSGVKPVGPIKSHTIYGKLSENKLWQKQ